MTQLTASARAHSNIALVKYWGKRNAALNLPTAGSISITLDGLYTDTRVCFDPALKTDQLLLNHQPADTQRIRPVLDLIRAAADINLSAKVSSENNFPTSAGLASSASGFAALVKAGSAAAGLDWDDCQLSIVARQGSGSAARSIFGGFVEMHAGTRDDGQDAFAEPLLPAEQWPLSVVVAITATEAKKQDSRGGMTKTANSSPFYRQWVAQTQQDLPTLRAAIAKRDFNALGQLAEENCLRMHAVMLSTQPALIYWQPATLAVIHTIRQLRADGLPVYFTIDAGPQVKAICQPEHRQAVATALQQVSGVKRVINTALGRGAYLLDTP